MRYTLECQVGEDAQGFWCAVTITDLAAEAQHTSRKARLDAKDWPEANEAAHGQVQALATSFGWKVR